MNAKRVLTVVAITGLLAWAAWILTGCFGAIVGVPAFIATPLVGVKPLKVQFTDQSTGVPTEWAWDFNGDGVIDSTVQNPTYTYTTAGVYTVSLTVTYGGLPPKTEKKVDYIKVAEALPNAAFSATPTFGPAALAVQFTDESTGSISSWEWDVNGDGVVDYTTQNPTHSYTAPGFYTVKLTVRFYTLAPSTVTKTDYIKVGNLLVDDDKAQCPTAGYTLIQAAVNAAAAGNVILVCAGSYNENLNITKGATILGRGIGVVNLNPTAAGYGIGVSGGGSNVTLEQFTLNAGNSQNFMIHVSNVSNFTIQNVKVVGAGKTATPGGQPLGGVDLNTVTTAMIKNVEVQDVSRNGISLTNSTGVTIESANVHDTGVSAGWAGIAVYAESGTSSAAFAGTSTVTNTPMGLYVEDKAGTTVNLSLSSGITFSGQTVAPIVRYGLGTVPGLEATGYTAAFAEALGVNFRLTAPAFPLPPYNKGASFFSNVNDALAAGAVDPKYAPYTVILDLALDEFHVGNGMAIQPAVNAASPGDTILVHPGTYDSRFFHCPWEPNCSCSDNYSPALIVYKDGLTIKSVSGPASTVIQSTHVCWSNAIAVENSTAGGIKGISGWAPSAAVIVANNVTIEGFTFHRPYNCANKYDCFWNTAGVFIGSKGAGYPDFLGSANRAMVRNNVFSDVWHAVYIWHSNHNTITNNVVEALGSITEHWAAIESYDGYNDEQIAYGNPSNYNTISYNTIADKGIFIGAWEPLTWTDNTGTIVSNNVATSIGRGYSSGPAYHCGNKKPDGDDLVPWTYKADPWSPCP